MLQLSCVTEGEGFFGGGRAEMCGIAGFWCANSVAEETARGWIADMTSLLVHRGPDEEGAAERCAREAYEKAGIGPEDLDVVECHDASAPAELIYYEELGLCKTGEGGAMIDAGDTKIGGRIPVNPSGGLLRKGHPVGATGLAQVTELVEQLRGQSGPRQVEGARVGLAQNGGGTIGTDAAAMCVTVVSR